MDRTERGFIAVLIFIPQSEAAMVNVVIVASKCRYT
jgi:hypothetical protein